MDGIEKMVDAKLRHDVDALVSLLSEIMTVCIPCINNAQSVFLLSNVSSHNSSPSHRLLVL